MDFLHSVASNCFRLQSEHPAGNAVVGKREKVRLKELQKRKRQKIQEILDTQNAAIDADMVCAYAVCTVLITRK